MLNRHRTARGLGWVVSIQKFVGRVGLGLLDPWTSPAVTVCICVWHSLRTAAAKSRNFLVTVRLADNDDADAVMTSSVLGDPTARTCQYASLSPSIRRHSLHVGPSPRQTTWRSYIPRDWLPTTARHCIVLYSRSVLPVFNLIKLIVVNVGWNLKHDRSSLQSELLVLNCFSV